MPVPPLLEEAIGLLERAPRSVRQKIAAAIGEAWIDFGHLKAPGVELAVGYPQLCRQVQARIVLGERPTRLLPGLSRAEAHAALLEGYSEPAAFILRDVGVVGIVHDVAVARWVVACWKDPERQRAILAERCDRGPDGAELRGQLIARLDEIAPEDLARGARTGVREAFASSMRRALERWEKTADTRKDALAPVPAWYRPIRCARLLMSAEALSREGRELAHCVGGYTDQVRSGRSIIVSLSVPIRSRMGGAPLMLRSTAELSGDGQTIRQHRATKNLAPHTLSERALIVCLQRWGRRAAPMRTGGEWLRRFALRSSRLLPGARP
ncbi:MAG: PcfJ domain-containing protein [Hyphomicrobiales bacterium]